LAHFQLQNAKRQLSNAMSAVHNLLRVAQHASSGIVALDATGLKEEGCNSLSGYPPTSTTAPDTSYYNEDSTIQKGPETLAEPSVTVNVSLLQGAAMETPASLDLATQRTTEGNKRHHHHRYHDRPQSSEDQYHRTTSTAGSYLSQTSQRSQLDTPGVSMGFMTGGTKNSGTAPKQYSRKRVAVARKRCYISNVASFEAFSTTEAEIDVRRAVDNLMNAVRADQLKTGGPTQKGELWKTIEAFFDAIPFVGIEGGEKGTLQFTQYIRCMSALREGIRVAMYDNYNPDVDHRTLIPCFSALHLARETIQTLEVAVQEAEKAVVDSVTASKTDVIMAFKKLKPREREDLRVYLEKREDFKIPTSDFTSKFSPYRTYDQNKRTPIPRARMGDSNNGGNAAAARWLTGGGGILNKLKTSKMETKMQSQHIELRQAQAELRQAQEKIKALQQNAESQGKHKLLDELCTVLGIDNEATTIHADDIIGRVTRMRRRNIDGALQLFEQQGTSPEHKSNMKKLVELLDITTFESGSVEEEIVLAVEKLTRQITEVNDMEEEKKERRESGSRKTVRKFKLKTVGNLIKQMNATDKKNQHQRRVAERKSALQQKKGAAKASKKEVKRFISGKGSVSNNVSLCGLLHGLNVVGSKSVPSGINVNNTLSAIYEAKVLADKRADLTGKQRMSLAQYLRTFLVHKYGVKKLALKHMIGIIKAIKKHRASVPRLNLFARLVGLDENDEKEYSSLAADYFLIVLVELYRATSVKQLDDNELDVAAMMKDGITKKRFLSKNEINIALHNIDMGNGDRQKITERIKKIKSWDVDNFLIQVMDCWYDSHHERLMQTEQVFFDSDENDDGELTLDEFMVAVRVMEPHCPKHDVIDLYDQIAGDDGVIDAEEFAQGVMLLHSHMIQHQRRIREDRRAAQIKDSSARKLKKAHGEQEQHQEHQEHQHFSLSHNNSSDKGLQQEELMYPHPPLEEKQKRGGGGRVGLGVGF
jgi:hypothetical protein